MSAQTSMYLRQYVLEHVLMGADFPSPNALYVGLFTEDPTERGTGAEVSAASYARQEVAWGFVWDRTDAATNSGILTFPVAGEDWGLVTHWAVFDAVEDGNMLYFGKLNLSRDTVMGVGNVCPAGSIVIDASGVGA